MIRSRSNKVLIITYYWPPAGGPGVQRVLKFAKYLPKFGWEPIILTVKNGEYPVIDESLEKDIPKCNVYKTKTKDLFRFYKKLTGKKTDENIPTHLIAENSKESFANFIRLNLVIPDARKGWISTIVEEGTKIIKQHHPKFIFASSPPHSVQVGAAKLAKKNHLRLISDYRDPWLEIVYYQNQKRSQLTEYFDAKLEKETMNAAYKVVTISKELQKTIQKKVDDENKVKIIPNGFDKEDFINIRIKRNTTFTITYAGVINDERIPFSLLNAMVNLLNQGQQIKLQFFGKVCSKLSSLVSKKNLEDCVEYNNFVAHDLAIKEMMNSQLLLFVIDDVPQNKGFLTGKLFDYLGCMRPILGIGPVDGNAANLLDETDSGKMFDYDDDSEVEEFLKESIADWRHNKDRFTFESQDYTRENLTKKLIEEFR
ncbi:MAG: glycosyltransferase [Candidatus Cloacimonadota bacterium]|nr:glycosyltransferase [Candidatus Cloacimonadota bacterium]